MKLFNNEKMNRNSTMTLALLSALSLPATGWTDDRSAASTQAQIGATLEVTQASINQTLDKLRNNLAKDSYVHADYLAKRNQQEAKFQKAMDGFEKVLKEEILPKLEFYMASYDNIYLSSQRDTTKNATLEGQRGQLDREIPPLSAQYQLEIRKLYEAGGVELISAAVPTRFSRPECYDNGWSLTNGGSNINALFGSYVFPALIDGCASQSCISLSATDQMLFYELVKEDFDHSLPFKLADGNPVQLWANSGVNVYGDNGGYCQEKRENTSWAYTIQESIDLFGRADFYPDYVNQLPMDVKDSDLAAALSHARALQDPKLVKKAAEEARRNKYAKLKDVLSKVQSDNDGGFYPNVVQGPLTEFCAAEPVPCLSDSEASDLKNAVTKDRHLNGGSKKWLEKTLASYTVQPSQQTN